MRRVVPSVRDGLRINVSNARPRPAYEPLLVTRFTVHVPGLLAGGWEQSRTVVINPGMMRKVVNSPSWLIPVLTGF